jgi:hydroxymethylpyrimidine pyrophosphatase-like HAD family hydrolase
MSIPFPKLFITDLDGTALGNGFRPYARFPDPFAEFLDRLAERGCRYAINTTWDVHGQWDLVENSAVKSKPLYLMAEVGLRLARHGDEGAEFVQPYTNDQENQLQAVVESHLQALAQDVCARFKAQTMHYYGHCFEFRPVVEDAPALRKYVNETCMGADYPFQIKLKTNPSTGQCALSAFPKFLRKGTSVKAVMEMEGLNPDQIVVAGDEVTDLSMMVPELSTLPLCPDNACAEVKDHVRKLGGTVGNAHSGLGIIDAFVQLAERNNWQFE